MRAITYFLILVIILILGVCKVDAAYVEAGINYTSTKAVYEMGDNFNFSSSLVIVGDTFTLDDNDWTITATDQVHVVLWDFNLTYNNFSVTTPSSQAVQLNVSGFSPGIFVSIRKDGVAVSTDTTDGNGFISYDASAYSGEANWEIIQAVAGSLAVVLLTPSDATQYEYSPSLETDAFSAIATSPDTVQNMTLYTNVSGSWAVTYFNGTVGDGTKYLGTISGLTLGDYIWNAVAWDGGPNQNESTVNYTFEVVDTTSPSVTVVLNQTIVEAGTGMVQMNYTTDDYFIASALANVSLAGSTVASNTSLNGTLVLDWSVLGALGEFLVNISALDTSGNQGINETSFNVTDTVAPTGTVTANQTTVEVGYCIEINGTASDVLIDTYQLRVFNVSGDQQAINETINGSLTYCTESSAGLGIYQANMTANDTSGNSISLNVSFTVKDTTPPTVTQISPNNGISVTDPNQILICEATNGVAIENISFFHDANGTWIRETNYTQVANRSSLNIAITQALGSTIYWSCEGCDTSGMCTNTTNRTIVYQSYTCSAVLANGSSCLDSATIATNTTTINLTGNGNCSISCEMPQLNTTSINVTQFDQCNYEVRNGTTYNQSINGCDLWFQSMEIMSDRCRANMTAINLNSSISPCEVILEESDQSGGSSLGGLIASMVLTGVLVYYNYTRVEE